MPKWIFQKNSTDQQGDKVPFFKILVHPLLDTIPDKIFGIIHKEQLQLFFLFFDSRLKHVNTFLYLLYEPLKLQLLES